MKFIARYRFLLTGILIGAAVVFAVSFITTEKRLSQLQDSFEVSIETAHAEVLQMVAEVQNGGRSSAAAAIIADCTLEERDTFESYLSRLDQGLTEAELREVDVLFSRCAPVQSVRRVLVTMDLARRLEKFEALVTQRKQIGSFTRFDHDLAQLKNIASLEERLTRLSFDLVFLQREIIDALLRGESISSQKSIDFKSRGVALRTELTQTAERVVELRSRLNES